MRISTETSRVTAISLLSENRTQLMTAQIDSNSQRGNRTNSGDDYLAVAFDAK